MGNQVVRARPRVRYRVLYWFLALFGVSLAILIVADSGEFGVVWARYWPWTIALWWLVFQAPSILRRRGLSVHPGEVCWIVVVVMSGTLWTAATHMTPQVVPPASRLAGDLDLFDLLGENYEFEDHFEWALPPGVVLEIRNDYGSVHITRSDDDRVYLDTLTGVRASDIEEAAAMADALVFRVEQGDALHVVDTNRGEMTPGLARRFRTRLDIRVPPTAHIIVENQRGAVRVKDLQGPQILHTSDGEILARPRGGRIEASTRRGDLDVVFAHSPVESVSLAAVLGDVRLELPSGSEFTIDGVVRSGAFVSDFHQVARQNSGSDRVRPGEDARLRIEGVVGGEPAPEMQFDVTGGRVALIDSGQWPWGSFQ